MAKRKKRRASKGRWGGASRGVSAGGTGFTGKRPKDKPIRIGKGGFAGGVLERVVKV